MMINSNNIQTALMMKNPKIPFVDGKDILIPYLNKLKNRIKHYDYDCFMVICGNERLGKSTLAAQIGDFISDGNLKIENICMDSDEFVSALQNSKKGDVIIFDEAGINLFSRESMSNINRMLTKAFMVTGIKNLCIILCIPSFFNLDNYIRQHRLNLLFYIPRRGEFKVYSKKRAKEVSDKGSKSKKVDIIRANTVGRFSKDYPEYVREQYQLKSTKFKLKYIKDIKNTLEGFYSILRFAEVTGFAAITVEGWIRKKIIKANKVGGRWYIPKLEAERIVMERNRTNSGDIVNIENNGT